MQYPTAYISSRLSASILMMIILLLMNTNVNARPNFKMKTQQAETATKITFKVPQTTKVWVNVYNEEGRYVAELMNEKRVKKGKLQTIEINTDGWRGGCYTIEVRTSTGEVWKESLVIEKKMGVNQVIEEFIIQSLIPILLQTSVFIPDTNGNF